MKARLPSIQSSVTLKRGDESVTVPMRVMPVAMMQLLGTILPKPPDGGDAEQRYYQVILLVRLGYCLNVEGSDMQPATPYPDWHTATPADLSTYADALWLEIAEAGLTGSDYQQLIDGMTALNNRRVEEISGPKDGSPLTAA